MWGKTNKKSDITEMSLNVAFIQEGDSVVAYSPALDLATSAPDKETAKIRFQEIVGIFFEDLVESNSVEAVLTGLGWNSQPNKAWQPPKTSYEPVEISVPVNA